MSSSDSSDSDDEMRARLLASCVSAEMIRETERKVQQVKNETVKVGPYGDIELSKLQLKKLGEILDRFTEQTFEFREPKKKTNKRLADQERMFKECPNHRLVANGILIDMTEAKTTRRPKRVKETKKEKAEKLKQIAAIAVSLDQIKTMV